MTGKSRSAMSLTYAVRVSSVFAGICCAMAVSPDKASAQGWGATQYSANSNDGYTFTTSGTGAGTDVVLTPTNNTPTPSQQGTALVPVGGYMGGLRTMVAGNAYPAGGQAELKSGSLGAGINESVTYYDAQGRPAIPNSGYTWTGVTYSSLLFSTAANYTTNNSIIQTNHNGYGTVQLQDGQMCVGNSAQGQPQAAANGYSGTPSVSNSSDFGFQTYNNTGQYATYQGPGAYMADFTISGVLYYQSGQLTWGSETGDGVWVTQFAAAKTQAYFQQSGDTTTGSECQLDTPHVLSRAGQGDATCFSIAYVTLSGSPSSP